ncbi:MAG: PIN domain-containing protein [Anaerolineae bacterium]|nr:PIN domain-containing protein [Anaerolineae bacterium]
MIEYLRGAPAAVTFLESLGRRPATSVICVAELLVGARDDDERQAIERFLLAFDEIPVTGETARLGANFHRTYMRSHNTGLADALVAATAAAHDLRLVTFNARHYPMFEDVLVPYQQAS